MYVAIHILPDSHHGGFGGVMIIIPLSDLSDEDQAKIKKGEDMTKKQVMFFNSLVDGGGWSGGRVMFVTDKTQSAVVDQLTQSFPSQFDADLSPTSASNLRAARARGLTFDETKNHYIDDEGTLARDRFGQPL